MKSFAIACAAVLAIVSVLPAMAGIEIGEAEKYEPPYRQIDKFELDERILHPVEKPKLKVPTPGCLSCPGMVPVGEILTIPVQH